MTILAKFEKRCKTNGEDALWFIAEPMYVSSSKELSVPLFRDRNNQIYVTDIYLVEGKKQKISYPAKIWELLAVEYQLLKNPSVIERIKEEWGFVPDLAESYAYLDGTIRRHMSEPKISKTIKGYYVTIDATNTDGMPKNYFINIENLMEKKEWSRLDPAFVNKLLKQLEEHPDKMKFLLA